MGLIKKNPTGLGIFVRWDSAKQNKIYIGDKVKITTPRQEHNFHELHDDEDREYPNMTTTFEEQSVTGTLVLWMSKGLMLKQNSGYMKMGVGTK